MKKAKFILLALVALFTFFFSNDFGLIDVEKTSIITAIGIDKDDDGFLLTAQIAVPEATDTNAENQKAEISGTGKTIGEALKNTGDISGWFPKLAFCNLIIIGNDLTSSNVVDFLDYFAKTLRIQDSAMVVLSEKKAQDLLTTSTPLDNISSFAIQKILLKTPGFDRDVYPTDIKTFCSGHYSKSHSAYMPIVKIVSASGNSDSSSGQNGTSSNGSQAQTGGSSQSNSSSQASSQNKFLFDARTTALFKDGVKVGELSPEQTVVLNALTTRVDGSTIAVNNVEYNGKSCNYLLTVLNGTSSIDLNPTDSALELNITLNLSCKISDVDTDYSKDALSQDKPLPKNLVAKTQTMLTEDITSIVNTSIETGCDIFKLKEKLYRYHHGQYSRYKDDYLSNLKLNVKVEVSGQK